MKQALVQTVQNQAPRHKYEDRRLEITWFAVGIRIYIQVFFSTQLRVCCPMLYWYSCLKSYFLQCSMCAWGIQSWLEKTWEHHCSKLVAVGGFKLLFLHLTWHHDRKLGFSSRLEPLKPRSRSPFWCLGEVNSNIFSLLSYQVQRPVDVFNLFLMPPKPRIQAY